MNEDVKALSLQEAIERMTESSPAEILRSIPQDKLREMSIKICEVLKDGGLTLQQAEVVLEVVKNRLRGVKL